MKKHYVAVVSFLVFLSCAHQILAEPVIAKRGTSTGRFTTTGSMAETRFLTTTTLLPSGEVLVVGGENIAGSSATAELYDPAVGAWRPTGGLLDGRRRHTADLLPSGKVLIAGGLGFGDLKSAELYDPRTGRFSPTGSMATPRNLHTSTLLPSGQVLVVGGLVQSLVTPRELNLTAELYVPATGTWTLTGAPATPRAGHTATRLASGLVLIAGGFADIPSTGPLASAELYDPETGSFSPTGSLTHAREDHTATLLSSGQVLVAGGRRSTFEALSDAELYDPISGSWTPTGSLLMARERHFAALLPSGRVLVGGGSGSGVVEEAEIYDPETGAFTPTDPLVALRFEVSALVLPSRQVLVVGGRPFSGASAELYETSTPSWEVVTDSPQTTIHRRPTTTYLPSGRILLLGSDLHQEPTIAKLYDSATGLWLDAASPGPVQGQFGRHTATLLRSGSVLVAGGVLQTAGLDQALLYHPESDSWQATGSLHAPRQDFTATLLPSGKVLAVGGANIGLPSAELYDPDTGSWTLTGAPNLVRREHAATLLANGRVLVTGGSRAQPSSTELYNPTTDSWTLAARMQANRRFHTATLLPSGEVLVAGGWSNSFDAEASAELYDPAANTWKPTGDLQIARAQHTATLLTSGKVLVAGGSNVDGLTSLTSAELYDPATGKWTLIEALPLARSSHTAVLLPTGRVLVAGGDTAVSLLYSDDTSAAARRPQITSAPATLRHGTIFSITGLGFRGDSEADSGGTSASGVNQPLVRLQGVNGGPTTWLSPDPLENFHGEPMTLTFSDLPISLVPGFYLLTVTVAGVPSVPRQVEIVTAGPEGPMLRAASAVPALPQGRVTVPIELDDAGHELGSTAFSIDFDSTCLAFDPTDADLDGIPDALRLDVPLAFSKSVAVDLADSDGEIDVLLFDLPSVTPLPSGTIAHLDLTATCQPQTGSLLALVGFSRFPAPSFGNLAGDSVAGVGVDGSVEILAGIPGDCNGDGLVDAGDISACGLEIFDGDGSFWLDVPGGTFAGNPTGCDSNRDQAVDAGDVACTGLMIFDPSTTCGSPVALGADSPRLSMPSLLTGAGRAGEEVVVPVTLSSPAHPVSTVAFALRFDAAFRFDEADADLDGVPDAVAVRVAADAIHITYDKARRQLDVLLSAIAAPLDESVLVEVTLLRQESASTSSMVTFSDKPAASFGGVTGQRIDGTLHIEGGLLFADDFESGHLLQWSSTID